MDTRIDNNKDFVSICVPNFNRPEYIEPMINSIFKNADLPFELIIHDDASFDGAREKLIENSYNISTLILNNGKNVGLAESINRCVEVASSNYIIFINSDMVFNRSFLKDVVNVLNKPYVGFIGLMDYSNNLNEFIENNGTKFSFKAGIGSGCAFAFRKDVWEDIGRFDSDARSGCADSPFMFRSWYNGYFRAIIEGEPMVRNVSTEKYGNSDSSMGKSGYDCSFPTIFKDDNYLLRCKERWDCVEDRFRTLENDPKYKGNTTTDIHYWDDYSKRIVKNDGKISSIDFNILNDKDLYQINENRHVGRWYSEIMKDFRGVDVNV